MIRGHKPTILTRHHGFATSTTTTATTTNTTTNTNTIDNDNNIFIIVIVTHSKNRRLMSTVSLYINDAGHTTYVVYYIMLSYHDIT